jgi:serine phosphatase RsbU (regulator of sigma subunit)
LQGYKFAGYRIQEFPSKSKSYLKEIADILIPYEDIIVDDWIKLQYSAWAPHSFSREDLRNMFGNIFNIMLTRMRESKPEQCIDEMEIVGAELANRDFPFEALIMSLHFLEESYLPFLLRNMSEKKMEWLISIDEFFHAALASMATSYFQVHRRVLLDEARIGQVVQQSLLPDIPKRITDLEVEYIYMPAMSKSRVGGDLVDAFLCGDGVVSFIIGDLSGHGVEAAAESVMIRSLFRGYMREGIEVTDTIRRINNVLNIELDEGKFATVLAGIYNGDGNLTLVGAGHPYPMIFSDTCRIIEIDGMALAIESDIEYSSKEVTLIEGDVFVAYTDGLVDARNPGGFFGESRVTDIITKMQGSSSRAIAEKLSDEALRFAGGSIVDDVAILVLRRCFA